MLAWRFMFVGDTVGYYPQTYKLNLCSFSPRRLLPTCR